MSHKQCCMAITMYFVRSEKGGRERERNKQGWTCTATGIVMSKDNYFVFIHWGHQFVSPETPTNRYQGRHFLLRITTHPKFQPTTQLTKLARMHEKPKSRLLLSDNCSLWQAFVIDLNCYNKWVWFLSLNICQSTKLIDILFSARSERRLY